MLIVVALVSPPPRSTETKPGQPEKLTPDFLYLLHRFHNFGEDVFRWLGDKKGAGEVDFAEIDGPSGQFVIRNVKVAMSRRLLQWLEQEAARQNLAISLDVQH